MNLEVALFFNADSFLCQVLELRLYLGYNSVLIRPDGVNLSFFWCNNSLTIFNIALELDDLRCFLVKLWISIFKLLLNYLIRTLKLIDDLTLVVLKSLSKFDFFLVDICVQIRQLAFIGFLQWFELTIFILDYDDFSVKLALQLLKLTI